MKGVWKLKGSPLSLPKTRKTYEGRKNKKKANFHRPTGGGVLEEKNETSIGNWEGRGICSRLE